MNFENKLKPSEMIAELCIEPLILKRNKQIEFYRGFAKNSFCKLYLTDNETLQKKKKERERKRKDQDICFYNCDNYLMVRLLRLSKLEQKRLKNKLEELNLQQYEVSENKHFPTLNKIGNFREVFYKGKEIIF